MLGVGFNNGDVKIYETTNFVARELECYPGDAAEEKVTDVKWYDEFALISGSTDSQLRLHPYPSFKTTTI